MYVRSLVARSPVLINDNIKFAGLPPVTLITINTGFRGIICQLMAKCYKQHFVCNSTTKIITEVNSFQNSMESQLNDKTLQLKLFFHLLALDNNIKVITLVELDIIRPHQKMLL